jgi:hypothetical protein
MMIARSALSPMSEVMLQRWISASTSRAPAPVVTKGRSTLLDARKIERSGIRIPSHLHTALMPRLRRGIFHVDWNIISLMPYLVCGLRGYVAVRTAAPTTPHSSLISLLRCSAEQLAQRAAQ